MLYGIINEQGNCLDVRDDISGKMNISHMFSYQSLVFGALILKMIVIGDYKPMDLCYTNTIFHIFPIYL